MGHSPARILLGSEGGQNRLWRLAPQTGSVMTPTLFALQPTQSRECTHAVGVRVRNRGEQPHLRRRACHLDPPDHGQFRWPSRRPRALPRSCGLGDRAGIVHGHGTILIEVGDHEGFLTTTAVVDGASWLERLVSAGEVPPAVLAPMLSRRSQPRARPRRRPGNGGTGHNLGPVQCCSREC